MAEIVIATRQAASLNRFSARRNKAIPRKAGINMKIGYAKESGIWFPLSAKKKILLNEEIDTFACDSIDENNNFEHLCENMRNGDSLIICGVDDIGNTKEEIEETWRRLHKLNIEIYVLTAPMLFYRENMTLEESFIRDVSLSVLASQVEIANQKLKAINDL